MHAKPFKELYRYSSFVIILEFPEIDLGVSEFLIQRRRYQDLSFQNSLTEIS